ncbi:MAG: transporter [Nitrospirota bacterium]
MRRLAGIMVVIMLVAVPVVSRAMHPLITDDDGTQGKGKYQFEVNASYGKDRIADAGSTVRTVGSGLVANLTYGAAEALDVFVETPYAWWRAKTDGDVLGSERGIADVSVGAKWRFFEKDGLCFAVKPAITIPTGDENKELGTGKAGYGVYLIATKEFEPAALFLNLGYIKNENKAGEEKDIWHVSLAGTYEVVKHLKLAANMGMEKNRDKAIDKDPAFGLVGVIYGVNDDLDLSFGVKRGLNDAETDLTLLAGVTMRF